MRRQATGLFSYAVVDPKGALPTKLTRHCRTHDAHDICCSYAVISADQTETVHPLPAADNLVDGTKAKYHGNNDLQHLPPSDRPFDAWQ
jgi:hypothetical protein